jgi:hypothetical protein
MDRRVRRSRDKLHREVGTRDPAAARFLAGGLVELLFAWVDARQATPAAEVERQFVRLAARVVPAQNPG